MFVVRLLKLPTAWKFPLHGPRNYVDWSSEMPANCSAFFVLSLQTPFETFKLKSLQQLTVQILSKLIVLLTLDSRETSSKRWKKACLCFLWYSSNRSRDVFGQLIEESNLPKFNVAYKLVVCYTAVFSVVTQCSSSLTAAENRTTFLSRD